MKWVLFLDDLRTLDQAGVSYSTDEIVMIARNMDDAIFYVLRHGIPQVIHFDHDLAEEHYIVGQGDKTGYDFAKWLCDYILDNNLEFPENFRFAVHSMNPVGRDKIINYMNAFIEHYNLKDGTIDDNENTDENSTYYWKTVVERVEKGVPPHELPLYTVRPKGPALSRLLLSPVAEGVHPMYSKTYTRCKNEKDE